MTVAIHLKIMHLRGVGSSAAICHLRSQVVAGGMLSKMPTSPGAQPLLETVTQWPQPVWRTWTNSAASISKLSLTQRDNLKARKVRKLLLKQLLKSSNKLIVKPFSSCYPASIILRQTSYRRLYWFDILRDVRISINDFRWCLVDAVLLS